MLIPKGSQTAFRDDPSERSDAGNSIVQEVFGFVKRNLSEAQRRKDGGSGERGAGKGAAALVPAQRCRDPERDQRSEAQFNWINQHFAVARDQRSRTTTVASRCPYQFSDYRLPFRRLRWPPSVLMIIA